MTSTNTTSPNVVIVLLDDVGFGASSTFGGLVETPAVEEIARQGLRYNRFHTTAICSPTRASLLTGRDAHVTGVGTVLNLANSHNGYDGVLRDSTALLPRILKEHGYSTACIGKWHLTPPWECSPVGPFDRWPTGRGFDTFYGFLGGETHQYEPTLFEGTRSVPRPEGDDYHLTEDLVDRSIDWIRMQQSVTGDKPFFLYLAPGATHAPLHVPGEWSERYRGSFAQGWDVVREEILERQKALGVVPQDAVLTPRPDSLPAWDSLSTDERAVAERLMEVYAGFLEHTDTQIARLVDALKEDGQFENTMFVYVVGDNGSSAEAGVAGSISYSAALQGLAETLEQQVAGLDEIGGKRSYPQYPAGWAWAMTSPFQWVKQVASHFGGTRNPMVVSWPAGIKDAGGLRTQFSHVNDVVPTILEAAGIEAPKVVNGVEQSPMDGTSLVYTFADADAPERHTTQYFEVFGHRSIYHEGWIASAFHGQAPWTPRFKDGEPRRDYDFATDSWELYDTTRDFSQATDLAATEPEKLAALQELFVAEAERVSILPLRDARSTRTPMPNLAAGRNEFVYRGPVGLPETDAPPFGGRSWQLLARFGVGSTACRGVLASIGGHSGGWSLRLDEDGRVVFHVRIFERDAFILTSPAPLAPGQHEVLLEFRYDGGGRGKGGEFSLVVDGSTVGVDRISATPPGYYSIDELFTIGFTSGSPVADHPERYPFTGELEEIRIRVE
ncbi:arylsulfatase [Nocardioides sp. Soil796]|uniref:arylsulfatase n=1 Tax=Nocardioides sp. Soil796 TaxID=1736412 RepID=UPI0007102BF0|nr:arylsulfatase [Nocardioides sp. Soil796]KRF10489.1 arylsulfatase [Nocardioides sp. Soil796]